MLAHLWIAPGIPLGNQDFEVPTPPPQTWCVAIREPHSPIVLDGEAVPVNRSIQTAEFRLAGYTDRQADYLLATRPPAGFRWLAVHGKLRVEVVRA